MKVKDHLPFALLIVFIGIAHFMTLNSHGMFMWDESEYANLSRCISEGKAYTNALRPPMMALGGALLLLLTGNDSDLTLKLSVLVFSLLNVGLIYFLMNGLKDRSTALLTAAILGFLPAFWQHSSFFLAEIPFLFFFTGAILFFYKGLYYSVKNFYPAWIMTGGAFLTRYTALLIGVIMILFSITALITHRREIVEKLKNKHFWISPIVGLLVLIPWLVHQQLAHGDFLVGFKIASKQLAIYLPGVAMPWDFYLKGLPQMLGSPSLILAIIGIGWSIYKKDRLGLHATAVVLFLLIWFGQYRYKELRLITSFLPFWAILAGLGFIQIGSIIWKGIKSPFLLLSFSSLLGLFSYFHSKPFFDRAITLGHPSFTNAMQYLRLNSEPEHTVIGASTPQINWYTNLETMGIPADVEALGTALDNSDWFVMVNFERGQPGYVLSTFGNKIEQGHVDSGFVQVFQSNNGSFTVVGRSSYFRQLIPTN